MIKLIFIDLYVAFHKLWCLHALTCVAVTEQALKVRPFLRYNGYCLAQNPVSYFFYYICNVVITSYALFRRSSFKNISRGGLL